MQQCITDLVWPVVPNLDTLFVEEYPHQLPAQFLTKPVFNPVKYLLEPWGHQLLVARLPLITNKDVIAVYITAVHNPAREPS